MSGKGYMDQPQLHPQAVWRAAQLTYPANFREAMRQAWTDPSKTLFGIGQGIASVAFTKILAATKPDYIWFDVEHATFDRASLFDAIHAAHHHSEGRTMAIVRVPKNDETILVTALDAGAAAIIIPHCESADDIKSKVKEIYYPPIGKRSFSPWLFAPGISDASLYENDGFNMETSNSHVGIIAQIESVEGLNNIDEIASADGVTALMFGMGDFMADAGLIKDMKLGGAMHPTLVDAMQKMSSTSLKYGKPLFGATLSDDMVPMLIDDGYRAITTLFDVWGLSPYIHSKLQTGRAHAVAVAAKYRTMEANGASKKESK